MSANRRLGFYVYDFTADSGSYGGSWPKCMACCMILVKCVRGRGILNAAKEQRRCPGVSVIRIHRCTKRRNVNVYEPIYIRKYFTGERLLPDAARPPRCETCNVRTHTTITYLLTDPSGG